MGQGALNYYPHHIGDYLRDTVHLSALEDGTYRRLLDLYYASEKPLPLDFNWLCKLARAREETEREAVHEVLRQFFQKTDEGWRNKRAEEEIKLAAKRAKAARSNGKKGGRPKTQWVSSGLTNTNPQETQGKAPKTKTNTKTKLIKNIVGLKPDALQVLEFLNEKTGRNYEPVPANLELILARLKEGASVDDLRAVVAKKCREWSADEKMSPYLRPATLFNRTKFAQYRGELTG